MHNRLLEVLFHGGYKLSFWRLTRVQIRLRLAPQLGQLGRAEANFAPVHDVVVERPPLLDGWRRHGLVGLFLLHELLASLVFPLHPVPLAFQDVFDELGVLCASGRRLVQQCVDFFLFAFHPLPESVKRLVIYKCRRLPDSLAGLYYR